MLVDLRSFQYGTYRLAYEIHGNGATTIVLLHGLLLDAHINRGLALALATAGYKVVLLDVLGHGRSDRPADATLHRFDHYARQVVALLDELELKHAVIGGLSLGANVGLHVAAIAPQRVQALLLEMPVMEWATPAAALLFTPLLLGVRFAQRPVGALARLMRRLPRPRNELLTSLMNLMSMHPEEIGAVLHGILVGPVVPEVSARNAIRAPTLIIGHPGDFLHPFDDAEALARQIPGASLIAAKSILELRLRPQRLLPQILDFLGAATAPGAKQSGKRSRRNPPQDA